jgi:aminomethyltransferase
MNADQAYSPYEIGLGRLVDLDKGEFVGKRALAAEHRAGGPARRLVGLELSWDDIVALYDAQGLPPAAPAMVSRSHTPLFDVGGGRQIGRVTSLGWSPILKKPIALASVPASHEPAGSRLSVEWTVEARRGRVGATVVALPIHDQPRKRA